MDLSKLEELESLISRFHAVKQIRAWAAEENAERKARALALIRELIEQAERNKS